MKRRKVVRVTEWATLPGAQELGAELDPLAVLISRRAAQRMVRRRHAVRRAIAALPPRQRALIEMTYGLRDGRPRSVAEAAATIGLSRATGYRVRQRALANLRVRLREPLGRIEGDF